MISSYFKKEPLVKTVLIQARIPSKLAKEIAAFKREKQLTWNAIVLGSLQALSDEMRKKK